MALGEVAADPVGEELELLGARGAGADRDPQPLLVWVGRGRAALAGDADELLGRELAACDLLQEALDPRQAFAGGGDRGLAPRHEAVALGHDVGRREREVHQGVPLQLALEGVDRAQDLGVAGGAEGALDQDLARSHAAEALLDLLHGGDQGVVWGKEGQEVGLGADLQPAQREKSAED